MRNLERHESEKLEAYLEGGLSDEQKREVENNIKTSSAWKENLFFLKAVKETVEKSGQRKAPPGFANEVMKKVARPKPVTVQNFWVPTLAAGMACLMIGLFLGAEWTAPKSGIDTPAAGFNPASIVKNTSAKDDLSSAVLALNNGDLQTAKDFLSDAEKKPDFQQFKSRGLNRVVIKELLSQGDSQSLVEYLENFVGERKRIQL